MLSPHRLEGHQIPLIHEVHDDDQHLRNTLDGEWFDILYCFRWEDYRQFAADYYNALYDFNQLPPHAAAEASDVNAETKEEARQRLMFERATAPIPTDPPAPILYQGEVVEGRAQEVRAADVAPGVVPARLVGRKPKCFFGLLKSNPAFARVCGFSHKEKDRLQYHYQQVPSLRKLEPFDQIMTDAGIWARIKLSEVTTNLR